MYVTLKCYFPNNSFLCFNSQLAVEVKCQARFCPVRPIKPKSCLLLIKLFNTHQTLYLNCGSAGRTKDPIVFLETSSESHSWNNGKNKLFADGLLTVWILGVIQSSRELILHHKLTKAHLQLKPQ